MKTRNPYHGFTLDDFLKEERASKGRKSLRPKRPSLKKSKAPRSAKLSKR